MAREPDRPGLHFLHISKTGGTTFKKMVRSQRGMRRGRNRLVMHNHNTTLMDVLSAHPENEVVFFLRDPLSRFVSGFNSRLREGAPAKVIPWKPEESLTFERFPTASALAEGLDDPDPYRQDQAFAAMGSMVHSRMHYTRWFRSVGYLESRIRRIRFVGFQESYATDVEHFFALLGVSTEGVEHHHQAPGTSATELSERARANLQAWYQEDIAIFDWARSRASQIGAVDEVPSND